MEKNIYIRALEIGEKNMKDGISYNNLVSQLGDEKLRPNDYYTLYFRLWFFRHFYVKDVYGDLQRRGKIDEIDEIYNRHAAILTEEGYTELLNFRTLEQAKIDMKKAHRLALWAIYISAGMALIQIIIQLKGKN